MDGCRMFGEYERSVRVMPRATLAFRVLSKLSKCTTAKKNAFLLINCKILITRSTEKHFHCHAIKNKIANH